MPTIRGEDIESLKLAYKRTQALLITRCKVHDSLVDWLDRK